MQYSFLRTYKRKNFRCGVERHVIPMFVKIGDGATQFRCTHRGLIAVGLLTVSHIAETLYGLL